MQQLIAFQDPELTRQDTVSADDMTEPNLTLENKQILQQGQSTTLLTAAAAGSARGLALPKWEWVKN